MTETLAHEYSSESTELELSKEYQHDRVWMVFFQKNNSTKVASALEGSNSALDCVFKTMGHNDDLFLSV